MRIAARFPSVAFFASETFFGSHAAVVRAVLDGVVDVGASYGGFSEQGSLVRGAFLNLEVDAEELRVVETFGEIPPDVIAVHAQIGKPLECALATAFESTAQHPAVLDAVRSVFGAMFFSKKPLARYDLLRAEVEAAVDSGTIPSTAPYMPTRWPPQA
jgi:ABC-type phosphate/phosphonate transport system substrate-binding protein